MLNSGYFSPCYLIHSCNDLVLQGWGRPEHCEPAGPLPPPHSSAGGQPRHCRPTSWQRGQHRLSGQRFQASWNFRHVVSGVYTNIYARKSCYMPMFTLHASFFFHFIFSFFFLLVSLALFSFFSYLFHIFPKGKCLKCLIFLGGAHFYFNFGNMIESTGFCFRRPLR